jgi:hypothetical protein
MSDVAPPGMPDNPSNAAPSTTPPSGSGGGGLSKNAIIGIFIAALVIVALVAFFVGRSNGESKGKDQVNAEYKPGKPKFNAIYRQGQNAGQATGQQQGQVQGTETGKKVGLEKGKQQGQVTGANDVFGAYSSWNVGSFYIVQIGQGSNGVDYTLGARTQMVEGEQYKLCQDDPSSICVVSAPSSSTGG